MEDKPLGQIEIIERYVLDLIAHLRQIHVKAISFDADREIFEAFKTFAKVKSKHFEFEIHENRIEIGYTLGIKVKVYKT